MLGSNPSAYREVRAGGRLNGLPLVAQSRVLQEGTSLAFFLITTKAISDRRELQGSQPVLTSLGSSCCCRCCCPRSITLSRRAGGNVGRGFYRVPSARFCARHFHGAHLSLGG